MKITLVRHGKPQAASNEKVNAKRFSRWVDEYNGSLVSKNSVPNDELKAAITPCYAISSRMVRAEDSARICLNKDVDLALSDLNEMDICRLNLPITCTINTWLLLNRIAWFLGGSGSKENFKEAKQRLQKAIEVLNIKVKTERNLVVFGHGLANNYIAKQFKKQGWQVKRVSSGYWGVIELTY